MNVRNCRKCGKIFNYVVGPIICPVCKEKVEVKFQEVKIFVQDHPGSGVSDISRECDVEIQQIQQWIREERLVFAADSPIGIECESCGTMIKTGRFCDKCKAKLTQELSPKVTRKPTPQRQREADGARMRYLDH